MFRHILTLGLGLSLVACEYPTSTVGDSGDDTNTEADADTDSDSDTDADSDADSDTDADSDADADADADADSDADTDADSDADADVTYGTFEYTWSYGTAGGMYVQWTHASTEEGTYGWVEDSESEPYTTEISFQHEIQEGDWVRVSSWVEIEGSGTVWNCTGDGAGMTIHGSETLEFHAYDGTTDYGIYGYYYDKGGESYSGGCERIFQVVGL